MAAPGVHPGEDKESDPLAERSPGQPHKNASRDFDAAKPLLREAQNDDFPAAIKYVLTTEICERFCFYGLRAILVLYFVQELRFNEDLAITGFSAFSSFLYVMPIIGGYVADKHLGRYRTILAFCMVYAFGACMLATSTFTPTVWGAVLGLAFIAIGTGGIKPCVSAFGGEQFDRSRAHLLPAYFQFFYFAINLGSVTSYIVTPLLRTHFGYPAAFGVPAILLFIGAFIFWAGSPSFVKRPAGGAAMGNVARCFAVAAGRRAKAAIWPRKRVPLDSAPLHTHWLEYALPDVPPDAVADTKAIIAILPVLSAFPVYWSCFGQMASTWTLQALDLNRKVYGYTLQPEQLGILNPALVLAFLPAFNRVGLPALARAGLRSDVARIVLGMLLVSAAYVCSAALQYRIFTSPAFSVSVLWMVPQFVLITAGEILVSVTGLEFAFRRSPASSRSLVAALYYLASACGEAMIGVLYSVLDRAPRHELLALFAALMLVDAAGLAAARALGLTPPPLPSSAAPVPAPPSPAAPPPAPAAAAGYGTQGPKPATAAGAEES
eukprot:tig00021037_g17436.t1